MNLKTHAKISTIVRREGKQLVTYTHYGTGNYHPITARIYTDVSLFTCDAALGRDATKVFNYLSGYAQPETLENISISPLTLKTTLLKCIVAEAEHAKAGKPAAIWVKLNSLIDAEVIDALYAAGQAGGENQPRHSRDLWPATGGCWAFRKYPREICDWPVLRTFPDRLLWQWP